MNREIKFRAFSKASNKMTNWNSIKECKNLHKLMILDHIELMQFTGLQDKNGVDIYEGDYLLDFFEDELTGDTLESFYPVVWNKKTLQWCVDVSFRKNGFYLEPVLGFFSKETLIVKGNIYEQEK